MHLTVYSGEKIDYDTALEIQHELVRQRQNEEIGDTLLVQEHPPVLTIGRNGNEKDILLSSGYLNGQGIKVRKIGRGGDVTYHGPGQLVAYPVIHLYEKQRSLRLFVEKLEQTVINFLSAEFSVESGRHPEYRGVWIGDAKIAALGISVSKAVTMHGVAINICPDLSHFGWIIPCGIRDKKVTSLQDTKPGYYDMNAIRKQYIRHFTDVFGYDEYEQKDYRELEGKQQ